MACTASSTGLWPDAGTGEAATEDAATRDVSRLPEAAVDAGAAADVHATADAHASADAAAGADTAADARAAEADAAPSASTGGPGCGLAAPALCDTFDAPAGIGNRSGQLNGTLWGVSRGAGQYGVWATTQITACGTTSTVNPPDDIVLCGGQLHEALDDNGGVVTLAMYPKQPFDFAGRTGKVVFDVSNDTQGSHGAWPEFWITDTPNPAPFTHEASWTAYPINGFGVRLAGCTDSSGNGATCPQGNGSAGVDSAIVVSNYVGNDSFNGGSLQVIGHDSVLKSGDGQLNHYEIDVSQNQIDVYGTDAYAGELDLTKTPLRHLATIPNANLSFTRGLIWIEDVHYNGNKFGTQRVHTFHWDNIGFDGPVLPRDLAFDVLDNAAPFTPNNVQTDPATELGYYVDANASVSLTVHGVTGVAQAAKGLLTLNLHDLGPEPYPLQYSVNGHAHTEAWPFPWSNDNSPKTLTIPVSLADVVEGDNVLTFSSAEGMTVSNVDLIMVGAGGVVTP
jgi:hypothetical protein